MIHDISFFADDFNQVCRSRRQPTLRFKPRNGSNVAYTHAIPSFPFNSVALRQTIVFEPLSSLLKSQRMKEISRTSCEPFDSHCSLILVRIFFNCIHKQIAYAEMDGSAKNRFFFLIFIRVNPIRSLFT